MSDKANVLENYKIIVGNKTYVFDEVPLTKPIRGPWKMDDGEILIRMAGVCHLIMRSKEELLWDEFEFLAMTAKMSIDQAAFKSHLTEIMDWRSSGLIPADKIEGIFRHVSKFIVKEKNSVMPYKIVLQDWI